MMPLPATDDAIAAIATPVGNGGIGVVRISGRDEDIQAICRALLGRIPQPRCAEYRPFYDANHDVLDEGIALYFPAPHSFTGESVVELQAHGGSAILDCILSTVLEAGARLAQAGEFSLRAFLNDKIDLLQAESMADLIAAGTAQAARSASRSLQGVFSDKVAELASSLMSLRTYVEASIDFAEEEIDFLAEGEVLSQVASLLQAVDKLLGSAEQGQRLASGITMAIVGAPNAGKSSLLNCLTGRDAAIVTSVAGTTRDLLWENIHIDGLPIHLVDTAGLREASDEVEREGVERAWKEIQKADCILFVWALDVNHLTPSGQLWNQVCRSIPEQTSIIAVGNKRDLLPCKIVDNLKTNVGTVYISAQNGLGVDQLCEEIKQSVGYLSTGEPPFTARRRHVQGIKKLRRHLLDAMTQGQLGHGELLAQELKDAQSALSELTGVVTTDDLLGEIFSSFCVGK